METIDRFFKIMAHLYLVNEHEIVSPSRIVFLYIIVKWAILHQIFKIRKIKIDMDHVYVGYLCHDIVLKGL